MPGKRTITKVCPICGGRVRINAAKYCSRECYLIGDSAKWRAQIQVWLDGDPSLVTSKNGELKVTARNFLKKEAQNKCSICGWGVPHPVDGIVPLNIDHIDGDPTNHHIENLTVLCPNCHSLTPTYGAKNRGNGRKNRKR